MSKVVLFADAMTSAVQKIGEITKGVPAVMIRDMSGRIRVAINETRAGIPPVILTALEKAIVELGAYAAPPGSEILCSDELFDPDSVFNNPDVLDFCPDLNGPTVRLLDRTVVGQDWLRSDRVPPAASAAPRIAFYGIKGGVGRSTAMAMAAHDLAKGGKRVLVVDMDLESPGLSGLLLPSDQVPDYGLVDWFVEDALGQGPAVFDRLTAVSPLSANTTGEIRVAPAIGSDLKYYVSKLSRVYTDIGSEAGPVRFIDRAIRIVQQLEERHRPDVVLIDSRAGLHDLAAVSIVGIADYSFLFASGTDATWQGYTALFSHWKAFPEVARAIRERLCVVYALFPETDQTARNQRFIEHSYSLFLETLYDEIEPPTDLNIPEQDRFTFDQHDSTAPHYPWKIKWSGRFQEFSGSMIDQGVLDDLDITGAFGEFLARVRPLAERSQA